MIKSINLLIFVILSIVSIQAQNGARLDSIRTTSKLNPDSNPSFTGTDFIYDGNTLQEQINFRITDGVKETTTNTKFHVNFGTYDQCSEFYVGGNFNRYNCNFDTIVNGKKGLCSKIYRIVGQTFNLDFLSINFKSFDNNENLLVDSTLVFKVDDLSLEYTNIFCYTYDSNNNVKTLIKKKQEGSSTFYGDLTEHEITYDGQGRKEFEIIKWTYILIPRTIDSLVFTYEDEKIIEHRYSIYTLSSNPPKDLIITTSDDRGLLNIKDYKRNQFTSELFLSRNLDYYYSGPSSTTDTKFNLQTIYPNPTSQYINIDAQITSAAILDVTGHKVIDFHQPINRQIDVSGLPAGIYFLEPIIGNVKVTPFKFVKY